MVLSTCTYVHLEGTYSIIAQMLSVGGQGSGQC